MTIIRLPKLLRSDGKVGNLGLQLTPFVFIGLTSDGFDDPTEPDHRKPAIFGQAIGEGDPLQDHCSRSVARRTRESPVQIHVATEAPAARLHYPGEGSLFPLFDNVQENRAAA